MKLGTFFSGIGAVEKALKNIGIDYELEFFSEIDKYAIQSYIAIHDEPIEKNLGDITKIKGEELPYCDMWFGGFPCQDISVAGKLAGWEENTRSSLGWEMIRLAKEVKQKPKYILFENVKNITSKRFKETLELFKQDLEDLGYTLYDKVLNAKNYGIPQNRERYFLIASLGGQSYSFPEPVELKLKLKDMLEPEVDEKYYLSDKMMDYLTGINQKESKFPRGKRFKEALKKTNEENIAVTISTNAGSRPVDNFIILPEKTKRGYKEAYEGDGIYINRPHQKRGVVQKDMIQTLKTSGNDIGVVVEQIGLFDYTSSEQFAKGKRDYGYREEMGTLKAGEPKYAIYKSNDLKVRKLTPKECFRLMGFSDEDFNKASQVNSNSQLYKQAGNSIVVDVLEKILVNLLKGE